MKILICGAGSVGLSLIHYLSLYYNIVVIDTDLEVLGRIASLYDVQTVHGSASDPYTLKQADLDQHTHVLSLTQWDEVNLVACHLSHLFGSVPTTIARLENRSYFQKDFSGPLSKSFELSDTFSSHHIAASGILMGMNYPYCFDALSLFNQQVMLLGIAMNPMHPWVGKTVADIEQSWNMRCIRMMRCNTYWVPHAGDILKADDAVYGVISAEHMPQMNTLHGHTNEKKSILCLGSSPVLFSFLPQALDRGMNLWLLSDQEEDLLRISQNFPKVQLIQGIYHDLNVLHSALDKVDTVVATGPSDEHNILAAVMAHSYGIKHTAACIHTLHYLSPLCVRGVNQLIHSGPRIAMRVLQKITQQEEVWVYPLQGINTGALIQAYIGPESKLVGTLCQDWQEDRWCIVVVYRHQELIWNPDVLEAGDHIVASVLPNGYEVFHCALSKTDR